MWRTGCLGNTAAGEECRSIVVTAISGVGEMDADNRMQLQAWGWLLRVLLVSLGVLGGILYLIHLL